MTILTTASNAQASPPNIELTLDTEIAGSTLIKAELLRNNEVVRAEFPLGDHVAQVLDYDAQYNTPIVYRAKGAYLPPSPGPDWSETWPNTLSWTATGLGFSVGSGKLSSANIGASLTRATSGTIQRLDVSDPQSALISLLDQNNVVVLSVASTGFGVTVDSADQAVLTNATGSYTLTLVEGGYTIAGAAGWSATGSYSGDPRKVRVQAANRLTYSNGWPAYRPNAGAISILDSGQLLAYRLTTNSRQARLFNPDGTELYPASASYAFDLGMGTMPVASAILSDGTIAALSSVSVLSQVYRFATNGTLLGISAFTASSVAKAITANPTTTTGYNVLLADGTVRRYSSFNVLSSPSQFDGPANPAGIAMAEASQLIYIGDPSNLLVKYYGPTGFLLGQFGTTSAVTDLAVDSSDNVWTYSASTGAVNKFDPIGTPMSTFTAMTGGNSIAIDSSFNVFIANATSGVLRKYSQAGVEVLTGLTYALPAASSDSVQLNGFNYHTDAPGNLVRRVNAANGITASTISTPGPTEITVDAAGNTYAYQRSTNTVRKYNLSGVQTLSFSPATNSSATGVISLAVSPTTNEIFLADFAGKRVLKYSVLGSLISFWSTVGTPNKMKFSPDGHLNVVDTTNKKIRKYTHAGIEVLSFPLTGATTIEGLDIDVARNYYIIDNGAYRVQKYSKLGVSIGSSQFSTSEAMYDILVQADGTFQLAAPDGKVRRFSASRLSVGTLAPTLEQPKISFDVIADATSLQSDIAWLIHPAVPSLSKPIDYGTCTGEGVFLQSQGDITQTTTATLHRSIGEKFPIASSTGLRAAETFELTLVAWDTMATTGITDLLDDQSPVLLRIPANFNYGITDGWYSIGDLKIARPVEFDMTVPMRKLTLSATAVDPPVVVSGEPRTYVVAELEADTFAGLVQVRPTYLNLLLGS